jgi:DNA-binding IclR family transcriptional regulator
VDPAAGVVERVGALMRALTVLEPDGGTTTELARTVGLARPTAHRLLSSLLAAGLADREHSDGRWHLGPEAYLMGQAAVARFDVTGPARPTVRGLARDTGESAFFSALRGNETVCLIREDGSFPLRSHVLHEGIRFPLGVASAGMVILAYLDEREQIEYLGPVDSPAVLASGHDAQQMRRQIAVTRSQGYSLNPGRIVEGSWGLGAAVFSVCGIVGLIVSAVRHNEPAAR